MEGLTEDQLVGRLESDPGDPLFAQFADELRRRGEWHRALQVCLRGLSANPQCHRGRLILARLFYEERYLPFAVHELEVIHQALPENLSIERLLERLAPGVREAAVSNAETGSSDSETRGEPSGGEDEVVAEGEFDIDVLDDGGRGIP